MFLTYLSPILLLIQPLLPAHYVYDTLIGQL